MKKLITLIALIAISYSSFAQWIPQASGFTTASRGIKYMHAVNESVVWATAYDGSGGGAYIQEFTRTTDGGDNWIPGVVPNATNMELAMIFALNADTAYAPLYKAGTTTNLQGIYITTDGGQTWTRQASASFSNAASFPNVVHFFDETDGFCMGDPISGEFEIYVTSNGGTTWMPVLGSNIANPLSGEWGVVGYYDAVGDTAWFGTNKGRVFRTTDRGLTWEAFATSFSTSTFVDVSFANSLHGLAQDKGANTTGALAETFDGGATWTAITASGPTLSADFAYVPGTEETFVATGSAAEATGIAYSYDGGHNWTFFPDTEGIQFLATDFIDPFTGWVGAFNESATVGGMYRFNGSLIEPVPPTNLTAEITGQVFVNLAWNSPEDMGGTFLGYNIWRNSQIIESMITDTTFVDEITVNGGYAYMVTAVYDNGESEPSNTVEVEITGVAVNDVELIDNLRIFPNPSTGILNVKADSKLNKVQLVNLAGQVVYESELQANETVINTSSIVKGLYMLNITSDKGVVTRKVSIR